MPVAACPAAFARRRHFVEIAAVLRAFFTVSGGFANPDRGPRSHIFGAAAASVFPYPPPCGNECSDITAKIVSKWQGGCYGLWNIIWNYDPATFCNL